MNANQIRILRHVAAHGPLGCKQIMDALDLSRPIVYGFLYRSRCYEGGKGWIDNRKELPSIGDPEFGTTFNRPGEYAITEAGRKELARDENPDRVLRGKPVDLAKESGCICEMCEDPVDPNTCVDGYTPCCNELIKWPEFDHLTH